MALSDQVVLLGEPDPVTNELYRRALCAAFDVFSATDEATVLSALHTRQLRALVLEPAIFTTGGWARLEAVSQLCAERGLALVICSTLDERRRALQLGVSAYLVKPTLPAQLLATLRQVVESGGA